MLHEREISPVGSAPFRLPIFVCHFSLIESKEGPSNWIGMWAEAAIFGLEM